MAQPCQHQQMPPESMPIGADHQISKGAGERIFLDRVSRVGNASGQSQNAGARRLYTFKSGRLHLRTLSFRVGKGLGSFVM